MRIHATSAWDHKYLDTLVQATLRLLSLRRILLEHQGEVGPHANATLICATDQGKADQTPGQWHSCCSIG